MSERIFSDLTKNSPTDTGQGPVLGDGQTVNYDVSLAGFAPPFSVIVKADGGAGTVSRSVHALVQGEEIQIVAPGAVVPGGAAVVDQIPSGSGPWSRLRVKLVAGTPAPNGRTLVQVNGVPSV